MTKYTTGFAFNLLEDECQICKPSVGLIRKGRPAWQKGFLNGIGGHIEEGESALECQVREFQEEAGLFVPEWTEIAVLGGPDWSVVFFKAFGVPLHDMQTLTDEKVGSYSAYDLPSDVLFNLRWLIPLALDPQPAAPMVWYPTKATEGK